MDQNFRLSDGGASDTTTTSNAFLEFATSSTSNEFSVANVVNIANQEKLVELSHVGQNTAGAGTVVFVSNGAGGSAILAFSDGTNWKRSDTGGTIASS